MNRFAAFTRWLPGITILVPILVVVFAVALRRVDPPIVQELRLRVFDTFQRLQPRPYETAPVRIVDIDDASLKRIGQWPWPRTRVAALVDRLSDLGAAVIVFDVVFAEADRTSPRNVIPLWGQQPAFDSVRSQLEALPDHDDLLAQAFERTQVVTGFVMSAQPTRALPKPKAGFAFGGDDPKQFLRNHRGAVVNLPQLEAAATGNGSFNSSEDPDGIHRRVSLLFRSGEQLFPSLSAEALRVATGSSTYLVKSSGASGVLSFGEKTGIVEVKIAPGVSVPTNSRGEVWLHFTEPVHERWLPAWRFLESEVPSDLVEGHIIFVGASATALSARDQRATPRDPATPGVVLHAEFVEQALLEKFLSRPDWATGAETMVLFVVGLLLALLLPRLGPLWCAAVAVAFMFGVIAFSWNAFTERRFLIDPVFPSLTVLCVYFTGSLLGFLRTERERRRVRGAFSHYLAPSLVEELARDPDKLKLGGEMREMTLLFADVRGFTTLSEQLTPQELTRLVNRLLTPLTNEIMERRGTIDKYMGDCVMAFWNAPFDDPEQANHACEAALAMIRALDALNADLRQEDEAAGRAHVPLRIGIGLNTGMCCVGNLGSDQRFDYSVISDEVNLASRLEGQSKTYGVSVVLGENTREQLDGFATLELDLIRVKGKQRPVRIHTLVGDATVAATAEFQQLAELHAELLKAYRSQEWGCATELARDCAERCPALAALYEIYAERARAFQANPPGPDWDGVYTATSK